MKRVFWYFVLTVLVNFLVVNGSYKKEASLSNVSTTAISNITESGVSSGGVIDNDGGAAITMRGVCWDNAANPIVAKYTTTDGTGIGTFVSNVSGLNDNM